ncbi:MAG: methyltransferase domain-containing protein [Actinobacteria bacterium]|uniref:Unannotated protein n=1 Tax=freshwater metagenome TaxID=449393 RepID=A0A6J6DYM4_9ZZZZ|nr:methyltransferase domain-containing protein [Actinomycetota bacterium]
MENNYFVIFLGVLIFIYILDRVIDWLSAPPTTSENFTSNGGNTPPTALPPVQKELVITNNNQIYDRFYSKIYDKILYTPRKNEFELEDIRQRHLSKYKPQDVAILDVGCGTGHHSTELAKKYRRIVGLDSSSAMLEQARKLPGADKVEWVIATAEDSDSFGPGEFTTIMCLYFTIYYINRPQFFINANKWLKKDGYLVIHVVDPKKFDPTLDVASPFPAFSIQKYSKTRVINTNVVFNKMEYESKFIENGEEGANFEEIFTDKQGKFRRTQTHQLKMHSIDRIVGEAEGAGFKLIGKTDMVRCEFEYQYLLYFTKK